jgi:amino acid transporter
MFGIFSRLRRAREQQRRGIYYNVSPLRVLLFGWPVHSEHQEHSRLRKLIALPVFSSDAISSVSYATQQILLALGGAGLWTAAHAQQYGRLTLGITAAIVFLLMMVVSSYWQTIFAYPNGGGSYIVSKTNLGTTAGLVAGAALLIDYVLTVAVSIAGGVANLLATPIMAPWSDRLTLFCLIFIAILTLANLRGLKESGTLFALPTYWFIGMAVFMIVLGVAGRLVGWEIFPDAVNQTIPPEVGNAVPPATTFAVIVLILKAFANGCSAMTGVEAVSDGIPAFREPRSRNAAMTLVAMASILGFLFVGISWIAVHLHVVYWEHGHATAPPVIDQLSAAIFGKPGGTHAIGPGRVALYYSMQFSTCAILLLAANTSFADFPRLSYFMAQDRFLPRPLANLGDKLVYSNGIVLLGIFAGLLCVAFHGKVDDLIPLYAVGVFTAFTLSQSGMVMRWIREKPRLWWMRAAINGTGATLTGVVLLDIIIEKGPEGAWMVLVLMALLFFMFRGIHRHYVSLAARLSPEHGKVPLERFGNTVLILVPSLHRGILRALAYARSLSSDCRAIHINIDPGDIARLRANWEKYVGDDIPLVMLESPFRSLTGPLVAYLDEVRREQAHHMVTVVVPEFVSQHWYHTLLHNNSGLAIKWALLRRPGVIVSNVRYFLDDPEDVAIDQPAPS